MIVPVELDPDERSVPLDLTEPSSVEVGHVHSEFNARLAYALTNAGMLESHLIELRRSVKLLKADFAVRHIDEKKTDRDAAATLHKPIREIEDEIASEEANMKILEGVIGGYVKIVEGASREISRRENERTSRGD